MLWGAVYSNSLFAGYEQLLSATSVPEAQLKELSHSPVWRALLGYHDKQHSAIKSSDFFLSPAGSSDALQELNATLAAFRQPKTQPDEHPQCRFRGRYVWLERQLSFSDMNIMQVSCPQFEEFSAYGQATSISLIMATGFLGNPASYYGHLLLKINTSEKLAISELENLSINFGANIPPDENMMLYIFKGIFGGYDSSFTHQKYYFHTHNYGETELRDLWEYQLNLTPDENELLIAHLWEVMGQHYTYYFFNRNCAYRMGELLQVVVGRNVINSLRPWETPQAIMQRLSQIQHDGHPLVKDIRFLPSRQSRLYQRYVQLDAVEKSVLKEISRDIQVLEREKFSELPISSKYRVLDTLMDYYQFVREDLAREQDINNSHYRRVLSQRYRLPPGNTKDIFSSNNQPHLGRKPSYFNVGIVHNKDFGESLLLWLRPVYYDSLDSSYGHIKNASLSMGEVVLKFTDSRLHIKRLDLVNIENLSRNLTSLPGDRAHSWYLNVGAQQRSLDCSDCLAAKANAGIGYAFTNLGNAVTLGAFTGVGYWGTLLQEEACYASASLKLNLNLSDKFSFRAEAEHREFIGSSSGEQLYHIQARMPLGQQSDLRFYFSHHLGREAGLSMGFYW